MLVVTSPTYTPPPINDLHSGLRMVVADLTQTFSPPLDPASGNQWQGPNYVPTLVAELERLEAHRAELQAEIRERNAGYMINWTEGPPTPSRQEACTPVPTTPVPQWPRK